MYTLPQVIANSRDKFETEFKPYKTSKKYVHSLTQSGWTFSEINPW